MLQASGGEIMDKSNIADTKTFMKGFFDPGATEKIDYKAEFEEALYLLSNDNDCDSDYCRHNNCNTCPKNEYRNRLKTFCEKHSIDE